MAYSRKSILIAQPEDDAAAQQAADLSQADMEFLKQAKPYDGKNTFDEWIRTIRIMMETYKIRGASKKLQLLRMLVTDDMRVIVDEEVVKDTLSVERTITRLCQRQITGKDMDPVAAWVTLKLMTQGDDTIQGFIQQVERLAVIAFPDQEHEQQRQATLHLIGGMKAGDMKNALMDALRQNRALTWLDALKLVDDELLKTKRNKVMAKYSGSLTSDQVRGQSQERPHSEPEKSVAQQLNMEKMSKELEALKRDRAQDKDEFIKTLAKEVVSLKMELQNRQGETPKTRNIPVSDLLDLQSGPQPMLTPAAYPAYGMTPLMPMSAPGRPDFPMSAPVPQYWGQTPQFQQFYGQTPVAPKADRTLAPPSAQAIGQQVKSMEEEARKHQPKACFECKATDHLFAKCPVRAKKLNPQGNE